MSKPKVNRPFHGLEIEPKKVYHKQMKSGMHLSRSDTEQLKINMRVASGRAKKTISMPKLPWDKFDV